MKSYTDSRENGFHAVEALLIVIVLAILGAVGYYAYTNLLASKKESPATSTTVSPSPGSHIPPTKEQLDRMKSTSNSF